MSYLQAFVDAVALGTLFALVAMGIGLIFGVIRLVVVALSSLMEVIYRPLRNVSPATVLIATFAISFLLQNAALLAFGTQGENVEFLTALNKAFTVGALRIRWITVVGLAVGGITLGATAYFLRRTDVGLRMRAAAADDRMAQLLGVPVRRVVRMAFILAGLLAGIVTLVLAVQRPLITPTFGFQVMVPALVGVVVGGLDRLVPAALGGFAVGFATVMLSSVLPGAQRVFLDTVLFALVITILLVRPDGLFVGRRRAVERV